MMLPFALAVWLTVKRKCWMSFLASHNAFIAWAAGSRKSFLIKQISECTTKKIYATNTNGRAAKVLKNKAKTIHSFAEIGDCHEPKEVCCVKNICLNKLVHARSPCAPILTSGLLFTSYFRSPQLAETCDEKSEKFHPLSLYSFRWTIGSSEKFGSPRLPWSRFQTSH